MVATGDVLAERYRLDERIAAGGMGTVYAATDQRLNRKVALKILRDSLAEDARFVERFRREARSAASLSHPNVAGVFDYGKDGSCHFIVMEHAAGSDLARVLREEGPLDSARAVAIAAQVGDALSSAHQANMVHRDVKPGNVLVDDMDRVKVTDFGIARASGDSTLTATGSILGTAHYLSPEQAAGGTIEPSSDVYSLGIVLYEMLTNTVPFTGDSAVAVAMRHLEDEVPAPSLLRPDIPSEIDALVKGATAKEPARRFADGSEFAAAANAALTGEITAPLAAHAIGEARSGRTEVMQVAPLSDRWDAYRVGRYVVLFFMGLMALAIILAVFRAIDARDDLPGRRSNAALPGNSPSASSVDIPTGLIGQPVDSVSSELEDLGLSPEQVPDETSDLDAGLTTGLDPGEGDSVEPDSSITVFFSTGSEDDDKEDKDEEDSEDDEGGPPDHADDKGKDKDKDD